MSSASDNADTNHINNRETKNNMFDNSETIKRSSSSLVEIDLSTINNSESSIKESNEMNEYYFDAVVGYLEDMLIDDEFHQLQTSFLEKYWQEFEDSEENKHSYMPIFTEYTNQIEDFITIYLQKRVKNFEMNRFISELEDRRDHLEGEIFEVLLTLSDFRAFKELFLDYRAMKEGKAIDLRESLFVSSVPH